MTNIRVLAMNHKGMREGTLRVFKVHQVEEAISFMRDWIKWGEVGDLVWAILYVDGKQKAFVKGFKKSA